VVLTFLPGCGDSGDDGDQGAAPTSTALEDRLAELSGAGVFVGGVAFTGNLVSIHYDQPTDRSAGMKIFVTDGTPGGTAEWFEGTAPGNTFTLRSASGGATIEGRIDDFETDGTITLAGVQHNFFTRPAGDGAGTFEVTIGADGEWKGTSLNGSTLTARQTGNYVEGAVLSSAGERYPFRHNDLSRRLGYSVAGGAADSYLTIVTRQGTEIQGRGGDVKGGHPDDNIVSLDLSQEATPTPGVYHGRVAMSTDRLNFELVPGADGSRTVRVYLSDSEPEPAGDIQWWAEPVTGDAFTLTSKAGDATIAGTIADDGISGEVTLTDGVARRYFAAPSGQGAGIYTVVVAADRHHTGTSEQGAKLDLLYQDGVVMGTLTAPDGKEYPMLGADLAESYRYAETYSQPGTYTAFVAPRGRYVYGRDGDVRAGRFGRNIIGLDKKC